MGFLNRLVLVQMVRGQGFLFPIRLLLMPATIRLAARAALAVRPSKHSMETLIVIGLLSALFPVSGPRRRGRIQIMIRKRAWI